MTVLITGASRGIGAGLVARFDALSVETAGEFRTWDGRALEF